MEDSQLREDLPGCEWNISHQCLFVMWLAFKCLLIWAIHSLNTIWTWMNWPQTPTKLCRMCFETSPESELTVAVFRWHCQLCQDCLLLGLLLSLPCSIGHTLGQGSTSACMLGVTNLMTCGKVWSTTRLRSMAGRDGLGPRCPCLHLA